MSPARRGDMPRGKAQVALGRFFLIRGADPKKVLDQFYDAVIKRAPDFVDAYLASAELALDKQDYGLAAETLRKAPKEAATEPRFHYLMAQAFGETTAPRRPSRSPRLSRSTHDTWIACC